jgi:heparan-alpha-glucosaminide N-acetyltransferase
MNTTISRPVSAGHRDDSSSQGTAAAQPSRITSIDVLRGFVMFMMIFVNDLAGAGNIAPNWMVHFSDRHRDGSGMTFVDLVFPAFLFIVGMSVPVALGGRTAKGQPIWRTLGHVVIRTISLLFIGILMVHETPDTAALGWSGNWWCVLMYLSAITAFCFISPRSSATYSGKHPWRTANFLVRLAGLAGLVWLAFAFRGANGQGIVSLAPFSLSTEWYGILGLIGWGYLVACLVFLIFGGNRTAILGCMALLMCLFVADKKGAFEGSWLGKIVGIGGTLGSQGAIAVGGLLLGSMLTAADVATLKARTKFTLWFIAGCAAAALLLNSSYGISKNRATPSWCFWSCAITAALWYGFRDRWRWPDATCCSPICFPKCCPACWMPCAWAISMAIWPRTSLVPQPVPLSARC